MLAKYSGAFGLPRYQLLSKNKLIQIYDWYYSNEALAKIKKILRSYTFPPEMEAIWCNVFRMCDEQQYMLSLGLQTIDYFLMFGFCPYVVRLDEKTNKKRVYIPDITIGNYYVVLNEKTYQSELWYFVDDNVVPFFDRQQFQSKKKATSEGVFVWPNCMPEIRNGNLKTLLSPLFEQWFNLQELENNYREGDFINNHQTVYLASNSKRSSMIANALTEDELFVSEHVGVEAETNNPMLKAYNMQSEQESQALKEKMEESMSNVIQSEIQRPRFNSQNQRIEQIERKYGWMNNVFQLPPETTIVKGPTAILNTTLLQRKKILDESIFSVCGVPYSMAHSFTVGSEKSEKVTQYGTKGGFSGREMTSFIQTLQSYRQAFELFLNYIYDIVYSEGDKEVLKKVLQQISEESKKVKSELLSSAGEKKQSAKSEEEAQKKVADLKNRTREFKTQARDMILSNNKKITLQFPPHRNIHSTDLDDIEHAFSGTTITEQEYIEMMRRSIGLTEELSPEEIEKLKKERKRKEKLQSNEQKQPPEKKEKEEEEEKKKKKRKTEEEST